MKRAAPSMKLEFGLFKAEGLGNVGVIGVLLALVLILVFGMLAGPHVVRGLFFLAPASPAASQSGSPIIDGPGLKSTERAAQPRNTRGPGEALRPTKILQDG